MYPCFKRIFDFTAASLGLVVLSPVILLCMLLIYLEDKGDPIFRQVRVGENGEEFILYKLRTMKINAEEELENLSHLNESDGPAFKIKDDPRITKVGKILRKTSLDELPQLINIIRGEMSVVGPRPALPKEVEQYTEYQRQRLNCKQGLTCYWQITPNRNDVSFEDWVEMDLKYIEQKNFFEDMLIILRTFRVLALMDGR